MPEKGSVVLATAGRDAGRLFAVLECSEKDCLLADGRKRRLHTPKRKNPRHLQPTGRRLDPEQYAADGRLRRALAEAEHRDDDTNPERGR